MIEVRDGLTFDDVLLIPGYSEIESRSNIDTTVDFGKGVVLSKPFVSANMKTVTGPEMARKISELGGLAILHRFANLDEQIANFNDAIKGSSNPNNVGISVGVNSSKDTSRIIEETNAKVVCVDVAHGDHKLSIDTVKYISKQYPNVLLIAGNVATGLGAKRLSDAGADVVKVGVGPGCFAAGTRVLMSNGTYKNIEEIIPGDRVINKDGLPKSVLKAFSTGIRNVSKVRNSIFYKDTYVTPDHKYFVGDLSSVSDTTLKSRGYSKVLSLSTKSKKSKIKWCEIGGEERKALLIPRNIKFEMPDNFNEKIMIRDGDNGTSSIKTKIDCTLRATYDVGYMFGSFLGDGHAMITNNGSADIGSVHWHFGLKESFIAEKLQKCVKKITGKNLEIEYKDNIILCSLYHKPLAELLSTFGKKIEKHLPDKFMVNSHNYLQGVLDGLVDSGGYMEQGGRINFHSTSTKLIEVFNIIVYCLRGCFPNNQKDRISVENLNLANVQNFNSPYIGRINTTASKRLIDDFQISKLLEYTETEEKVEVFDLTIDCDTHSFIADNAIVHNSLCTTRVETGNGVPQLTALDDAYDWLKRSETKIIADGGIKQAGDIVKALCFSHAVMLGSMFAGTTEAPGDIYEKDGIRYKMYAGSSTHKTNHIEGVAGKVPCKGSVEEIVQKLIEGVRSGLSYQGCENLEALRECPRFVRISSAGLKESHPHANLIKG
jgi:IMP dehydrogenase/GMP reductase